MADAAGEVARLNAGCFEWWTPQRNLIVAK
jgi:hypothetical protein